MSVYSEIAREEEALAAQAVKGSSREQSCATLASLLRIVHEDWVAHRCDWTLPGFRAVAICRFGQWRMNIRSKILRAPFSMLYRALFRYARNHYHIELPYSISLGRRVVVEHNGAIVVHGNCDIGDECILRQGVTLGNRHWNEPSAAPILGERVNVGAGAKILGRIYVGNGAQIGANAVVLSDIPAGSTAVGIPARIVKHPPPEWQR